MTTTAEEPSIATSAPLPDAPAPVLPETLAYKVKNRVLGPPLQSEELEHQRLGIPTALAVFASDNISSSAYATEEILHILIPAVGVFAFSLVVPITVAICVVLLFLVLSYRQTIKAYPTAGGAYMVSRDNFGYRTALVAGVSLLTDYVLTVAVSVSAGIAALTSVVPALVPWHLEISLVVVALIALVNLRGVKESGRVFMIPTYLFIVAMGLMLAVGIAKVVGGGGLHHVHIGSGAIHGAKAVALGHGGTHGLSDAFLYGAGLWVVLRAFASGGAAVTGVEAISNGVTAFKKTEWINARRTLVLMASILGCLFIGLSFFATKLHPVPYESGSPTVISQVGKQIFGPSMLGHGVYLVLQAGTLLILVLAANTSFADFPRLASFAAGDAYMPRWLMKRGHRLVLSNGVIMLSVTAAVLMIATDANVNRLIPLYAVGVFTSFTLSQSGMARHHLREREQGWRTGLVINGFGAVVSFVVDVIILSTKFTEGAWVVLAAVPILVVLLIRMNRQYVEEDTELHHEASEVAATPILRRHVVLVMVDRLDRSVARALRYARTLSPDEMSAVHFSIDEQRARVLADQWRRLGLARVPLQIVECSDRRVARAALEMTAEETVDGETEVTVLIPRLAYRRIWHRLLHDRTGDEIARALGDLPNVNVTFVPYHLDAGRETGELTAGDVLEQAAAAYRDRKASRRTVTVGPPREARGDRRETSRVVDHDGQGGPDAIGADGAPPRPATGIAAARFRQRVDLKGRVHSVRVQPWSGVASLEVVLADETGQIHVIFLGRRDLPGLKVGRRMAVQGMVGEHRGRLTLLNPTYQFLPDH